LIKNNKTIVWLWFYSLKISMKKIILFCVFFLTLAQSTFAITSVEPEKPIIIPRASWWANEEFTSRESSYWQKILQGWSDYVAPYVSPEVKKAREEKNIKILNYINENFWKENTVAEREDYDLKDWYKLAWPLKYTQNVNAIVVHHTADEYKSSLEWIKQIYKYHSINRAWGDIGYNYVIWYDGEIFEGRKWWDYISAAHSVWNNYSTLGVAVMWNYSNKEINEEQYKSLEKLVKYLAWKYGIDFSNKYYYNMACAWAACDTFPLETKQNYTLAWHKDTWHTSCPWDKLYTQIEQIRLNNLIFTAGFKPVNRSQALVDTNTSPKVTSDPKIDKVVELVAKFSQFEKEQVLERITVYFNKKNISEKTISELKIIELWVKKSLLLNNTSSTIN